MFDRNTLLIAYDPMRGEPRGPRKRGLASVLDRARGLLDLGTANDYVFRASHRDAPAAAQAAGTITLAGAGVKAEPLPKFAPEELGDCIDCSICVQVCPTGIDIRKGLQYECIACGACIDACDDVMGKMGFPRGLIRYSTQNAIDGKPTRVVRPRVIVYAVLWLGLIVAWSWGVTHRSPLIAEVLRDRNALYRQVDHGIENGYTLKLVNKTDLPQHYRVQLVSGDSRIAMLGGTQAVNAAPASVVSIPVTLTAPDSIKGRQAVRFTIETADGKTHKDVDSSFFGPP
jgi:cytochrome c oxidase accessory protein FixG